MKWQTKEKAVEFIVSGIGLVSVVILLLIGFFLFKEAFYIFYKAGVATVIFGSAWYPTSDPPSFGMWPLIMGTFAVTFLTVVMAIPLGLATAVYIAEVANHRVKEFLKPMIEMLASFPSVVLGFFGMVIIAPMLSNWLSPLLSEKLPGISEKPEYPVLFLQRWLISVTTNCLLHPG